MRRKAGVLLPVEVAILGAGLADGPGEEFYGYAVARQIQADEGARLLTSHGTLYKALDRLVKGGLLTSRWEDPEIAARDERPRRRLYSVTAAGESAFRAAVREAAARESSLREGLQPS